MLFKNPSFIQKRSQSVHFMEIFGEPDSFLMKITVSGHTEPHKLLISLITVTCSKLIFAQTRARIQRKQVRFRGTTISTNPHSHSFCQVWCPRCCQLQSLRSSLTRWWPRFSELNASWALLVNYTCVQNRSYHWVEHGRKSFLFYFVILWLFESLFFMEIKMCIFPWRKTMKIFFSFHPLSHISTPIFSMFNDTLIFQFEGYFSQMWIQVSIRENVSNVECNELLESMFSCSQSQMDFPHTIDQKKNI